MNEKRGQYVYEIGHVFPTNHGSMAVIARQKVEKNLIISGNTLHCDAEGATNMRLEKAICSRGVCAHANIVFILRLLRQLRISHYGLQNRRFQGREAVIRIHWQTFIVRNAAHWCGTRVFILFIRENMSLALIAEMV